ncbi:MAG: sulfate ABC transporter permease subunit CysW [Planctomycetes bacterium]|nr:sulfate ABC transporter permease subunit CysW [Planctomycetota bacterium]
MHPSFQRHKRVAGRMVATEPAWLRFLLIGSTIGIVAGIIVIPMIFVFYKAFANGFSTYWENLFGNAEARHAIKLTLIVALASVAINTVCGVAAAWVLTKFRFPGRTFLLTLIDLPFAVSPVVAGLMFVLIFGRQGWCGPWLQEHGIRIIFSWPALILATTFVTLPFVARELIPLMQSLGNDEELAAVSLGANPWQMFWRVTLPNIKWALLFGIIQCNARAIGEFGAVYVVSGRISGETDTMAVLVQKLYESPGAMSAAYAVASVLTLMALATLGLKLLLEQRVTQSLEETAQTTGEAP